MANTLTPDSTTFKHEVQGLGRDIDTLKTDITHMAHDAAHAARSGATELRQGAMNAVESAKDKLEGAKDSAVEAAASLKDLISKNPVASIGIAAGVGLLIGLVVFRPRS